MYDGNNDLGEVYADSGVILYLLFYNEYLYEKTVTVQVSTIE